MLGREDEVARGRLVSLEGFSFAFRAKNEEWRDLQLVRWHLEVECSIKTIECVCVSPTASKEQIKFAYPVLKWLRTKILNENGWYRVGKKDQSLFESWIDHRKGDKVHFWQTFCAEIVQAKTKL